MRIFGPDEILPPEWQAGVVAIGNFDGLHRGHQALIGEAKARAHALGKRAGLLSFEPHPRQFFKPDPPLFRLTPEALKLSLAERLGLDFALMARFDREFAELSAEAFVSQILCDKLGVRHVVTGHDFHFGKNRAGDAEFLRQQGKKRGFGVSILEAVGEQDTVFSSSTIRQHLRAGEVELAAQQLGAWWRIAGRVVQGDQRGRTIGYPTANIAIDAGMEALEGIYAARVFLSGRWLQAAAYIGARPTFNTQRRFLEVYILDFAEDIYGQWLEVEFVSFIRPDEKFADLEALLRQMEADCQTVRIRLQQIEAADPYPLLRPHR